MKEFNMVAVKGGAKIETADGRKARYVGDINNPVKPLVIAIDCNGVELIELYAPNGKCYPDRPDMDLVMSTTKHIGFVNIFSEAIGYSCIGVYDSKEEAVADKKVDMSYVATVPVEWEE